VEAVPNPLELVKNAGISVKGESGFWRMILWFGASYLLVSLCSICSESSSLFHYAELNSSYWPSFGYDRLLDVILPWIGLLLAANSSFRWFVCNPLFALAFTKKSRDLFFVGVFAFSNNTFLTYGLALLRHIIPPEPSLSLLWLLDTHIYTEFRLAARFTVIALKLLGLFLSRHFAKKHEIQILLIILFDPNSGFGFVSLLSLIVWRCYCDSLRRKLVMCAMIMIIFGFFFNQTAFFTWWTSGIGNANFVMIGSLIYSVGIALLIYCLICYSKCTEEKA
jgi:hypothetical protein